ncbi:UXX-star selenoprotein family 1 [Desulfoluna spongiiphila]|uniref:UXX-star selenoprotein family 1 n=1 Tax=Desulfoluna spongiiphila TaxID=419481 RepID=UPI00125354C8|nr:UXX-star (seleno)protein family 1 [Desulfoluna spongiiphila]VVS92230.1 glutaredoxin [Desulfoluna spongiiphila]
MKQSVTIYGKDKCPFTRAAVDALREKGDEVVYIDVLKSEEMMDKMLSISGGGRKIPVIVAGGEVSVGWQGKT